MGKKLEPLPPQHSAGSLGGEEAHGSPKEAPQWWAEQWKSLSFETSGFADPESNQKVVQLLHEGEASYTQRRQGYCFTPKGKDDPENVSFYLSHRSDLIRSMFGIADHLKLHLLTKILAVDLMDRVFDTMDDEGSASEFGPFTLVCLVLAAKYQEKDPDLPRMKTFAASSPDCFELSKLVECEKRAFIDILGGQIGLDSNPGHFFSLLLTQCFAGSKKPNKFRVRAVDSLLRSLQMSQSLVLPSTHLCWASFVLASLSYDDDALNSLVVSALPFPLSTLRPFLAAYLKEHHPKRLPILEALCPPPNKCVPIKAESPVRGVKSAKRATPARSSCKGTNSGSKPEGNATRSSYDGLPISLDGKEAAAGPTRKRAFSLALMKCGSGKGFLPSITSARQADQPPQDQPLKWWNKKKGNQAEN